MKANKDWSARKPKEKFKCSKKNYLEMQFEQVSFYIGFDQVIKETWPNKRLHHKSFLFY